MRRGWTLIPWSLLTFVVFAAFNLTAMSIQENWRINTAIAVGSLVGGWFILRPKRKVGKITVNPASQEIIKVIHPLLPEDLNLTVDDIEAIAIIAKPPRIYDNYSAFPTSTGPLFTTGLTTTLAVLPVLSDRPEVPTVAITFTKPINLGIRGRLAYKSHKSLSNGHALGMMLPVIDSDGFELTLPPSIPRLTAHADFSRLAGLHPAPRLEPKAPGWAEQVAPKKTGRAVAIGVLGLFVIRFSMSLLPKSISEVSGALLIMTLVFGIEAINSARMVAHADTEFLPFRGLLNARRIISEKRRALVVVNLAMALVLLGSSSLAWLTRNFWWLGVAAAWTLVAYRLQALWTEPVLDPGRAVRWARGKQES